MWFHTLPILGALCITGVVKFHKKKLHIHFQGSRKFPTVNVNTNGLATMTEEEKEQYHTNGYILKKGLVTGELLSDMIADGEDIYAPHQPRSNPAFQRLTFHLWRRYDAFAQFSFEYFPNVAADLMNMTTSDSASSDGNDTIRILMDGFFGMTSSDVGCGFHVDDSFFWPTTLDSTGVNVWLALSPMRISEGGGIRVVNRRNIDPKMLDKCRDVIFKPPPPGKFSNTCDMEQLSPECHTLMMEHSNVFDMEPGDALIWDRWTFHRSEPFKMELLGEGEGEGQQQPLPHKLRYTIRYVPGTARAQGIALHESQTAGEVFDSPHYPQVWPKAIRSEINAIQKGLEA